MREGDEVVVNAAALDLGLGSGGFDVVHVNLTRGLGGGVEGDAHVMKLNYTSLQHPVEPVEGVSRPLEGDGIDTELRPVARGVRSRSCRCTATWRRRRGRRRRLARGSASATCRRPAARSPARCPATSPTLRERGLLCGHITAAPSYGGEHEALSTVGALDAAATALGWDAVLVGPGPGIIGSDTEFGHGGMAALDSAHASLSLGLPTILSPRLSSGDPRERHRGLSHHTATVLELLLAPVTVAIPEGASELRPGSSRERGRHRLKPVASTSTPTRASGLPTTHHGPLARRRSALLRSPSRRTCRRSAVRLASS